MSKICVSLTEETTAGVVERMEELAGIAQLNGERGVDDVTAREPEMEVAALRPDRLRDLADERDHD